MATLTTALTITSTDATTDVTQVSVTDSLNVIHPLVGVSRVASENSSGSVVTLLAASVTGNKYFYIKHTGLQTDASTAAAGDCIVRIGSTDVIRLAPGEWGFFPVKSALAVDVQSNDSNTILCEYAYWKKA